MHPTSDSVLAGVSGNRGISFGGFLGSIGDTVQDAVNYVGDNLQNQTGQGAAVINVNNATAAAIAAESARRAQQQQAIIKIVTFAIIGVMFLTFVSMFRK